MTYLDYDLTLTDEQQALREAAHQFAADVMRPAGIAADRLSPEALVATDSPVRHVLREASRLGYTRMMGPSEWGGLAAPPLTAYLIQEELAWGSAGLAAVIFLSAFPASACMASGDPDLMAEFSVPYYRSGDASLIGCWAITEPDHGSDTLGVMRPELRVKATGNIVARRDGDTWILKGQKSAWVSNAPIATHAIVNVHLEPQNTLDRGGVCIVPLNLPGVARGRPLDKHGLRTLPQGELFFDDVRIPRRYMLAEADQYAQHVNLTLTAFNAGVGCLATGLARAAYEGALAYTKERVQGGRPIAEHQAVRARLFRMFSLVQACRSLSRQVYVHQLTRLANGASAPIEHSIVAKVFCTDAALEVATLAVQLHGGNGMTKEYPAEMLLRDATACTVADGENAFLAQIAGALL